MKKSFIFQTLAINFGFTILIFVILNIWFPQTTAILQSNILNQNVAFSRAIETSTINNIPNHTVIEEVKEQESLPANWDPVAFLLGVCGLAATLAGIGFAVYGFYNTNFAEKIIEEKLAFKFDAKMEIFEEKNAKIMKATSYLTLGMIQFHNKKFDYAIDNFKNALRLDPNIKGGYILLGLSYQIKKDDEKSLKCFYKALEHDSESGAFHLAKYYMNIKKDFDTAFIYLEKYFKLLPVGCLEAETNFSELKQANPKLFDKLIEQTKHAAQEEQTKYDQLLQ